MVMFVEDSLSNDRTNSLAFGKLIWHSGHRGKMVGIFPGEMKNAAPHAGDQRPSR